MQDSLGEFNKCKDAYEQVLKEIRARGLPYLIELFSNRETDHFHYDKSNTKNLMNNNVNSISGKTVLSKAATNTL